MFKLYVKGIFIFLLFCLVNCQRKITSDVSIIEVDLSDAGVYPINEVFSSVDVLQLDHQNNLIGNVNKVMAYKRSIFLLDADYTNSLYEFDLQGNFIRKIGLEGPGPEEYQSLNGFTIVETDKGVHQVWMLDNGSSYFSILKFTMEGVFIEKTRTKYFAEGLEFLPPNQLIFSTSSQCNDDFCSSYFITNLDLELLEFGSEPPKQFSELWIESAFPFSIVNGNFHGTVYGDNYIYTYDLGKGFRPKFKVDFGSIETEQSLPKVYSDVDELFHKLSEGYAYFLDGVYSDEENLLFNFQFQEKSLAYIKNKNRSYLLEGLKIGDISISPFFMSGYSSNELFCYLDTEFLESIEQELTDSNEDLDLGALSFLKSRTIRDDQSIMIKLRF